jgi:3-deoxy-D-manno-octulosonic-acid transferase
VRLIVAPRHLERLDELQGLCREAGFDALRLSHVGGRSRWEVGLVDTFGQLPRYYGLASIVFIGGSLIPHGGQNPLEAAGAGKPVVFGPHMQNFETIAHQLLAHHAARQVATDQELPALFQELLSHRAEAETMGRRARELTERFQGATQRTLDVLAPLLHQPTWPTGYG